MRRRDFISLLGCTALWPVAAHAQPVERIRRIGVLLQATQNDLEFQSRLKTFLDGLAKFGWTEGIYSSNIVGLGATPMKFGGTRRNW